MKIKKLLYYYVSFLGSQLFSNLKTLTSGHSPTLETGLALLSPTHLGNHY